MTELDIARRAGAALTQVTGGSMPGLQVLHEWVNAAREAESLVSPLVDTPFLPSSLWPLPPGVYPKDMPNPRIKHPRETLEEWQGRRQVACSSGTAAVLTGITIGLDPLVALAQVFVVKGRPGLYAKIKVALAQRAGHDVWDEELTPERVTVCGRRKGWPADRLVRISLTIEQADLAGWMSNDAYRKTPIDMLWSRAVSRVLDRIAADTLNGIPSIETMDDEAEPPAQVTADVVDAPARTTAAAILARAEQPVATPAAPAPAPEPEVQRMVLPVSKPQLELIKAIFERAGMGSRAAAVRADRMRVLSVLVDRPIEDPRDLTGDEGKLIIDTLGLEEIAAQVTADILGRGVDPDASAGQAAWAPLTQHAGDVTEVADAAGEDHDPTVDPEWPFMTPGGDMAGEGQ